MAETGLPQKGGKQGEKHPFSLKPGSDWRGRTWLSGKWAAGRWQTVCSWHWLLSQLRDIHGTHSKSRSNPQLSPLGGCTSHWEPRLASVQMASYRKDHCSSKTRGTPPWRLGVFSHCLCSKPHNFSSPHNSPWQCRYTGFWPNSFKLLFSVSLFKTC